MCDRAGRDLQGPRRGEHGSVQGALRARDATRTISPTRSMGADVFVGLSVAGAVTRRDGRRAWRARPIIFALANPVPEILPDEVRAVRDDAIIATGRSDYPEPGQQRPRLPVHLPRRARRARDGDQRGDEDGGDARARAARQGGRARYRSRRSTGCADVQFGPDYLIPFPFDPRVLLWVAPAVAWAAVASGVAREFIDLDEYREQLEARLGRARGVMRGLINRAASDPKRIVFPEGEEPKIIRAAAHLRRRRHRASDPARQSRRRSRASRARANIPLDGIEIEDPGDVAAARGVRAATCGSAASAKGMSLDEARRRLFNGNYFGSCMVAQRRRRRAASPA